MNKATAAKRWALREIFTSGGNAHKEERQQKILVDLIKLNT
jgi:hypothetical protein